MNFLRSQTTRLLFALALLGMAISGYLTTVHYADRPIICAGISSCETVNTSTYASVGGVPVALLGLGAYSTIALLALLSRRLSWALPALTFTALVGVLYSAYLTWVELAVLHAICLWCVTSAVVITAIAVLSVWQMLRAEPTALAATLSSPRPRRPARGGQPELG